MNVSPKAKDIMVAKVILLVLLPELELFGYTKQKVTSKAFLKILLTFQELSAMLTWKHNKLGQTKPLLYSFAYLCFQIHKAKTKLKLKPSCQNSKMYKTEIKLFISPNTGHTMLKYLTFQYFYVTVFQ